jgi:hypothetical protein
MDGDNRNRRSMRTHQTWTAHLDRQTADLQLPIMPRYAVTFTYKANGQQYSGRYIVHAEVAAGHTFTICYDPEDPKNNSGSEDSLILHPKMLRLVAVIAVFLLLLAKHWFRHYR